MPGFVDNFVEMRNGAVAAEASNQWNTLVTAVMDTGKPGKIVLEIDLKPTKIHKGEVKEVEAAAKVTIKEPRETPGTTLFHVYKGGLHRQDPNQMELMLQAEEKKNA